jgi:arachidonate 15-lipoxygenase
MRLPTRQQRHQQLIEQYVLSRRTMLALLGLACTPGLENLVKGDTPSDKPNPPANPHIPTLPQHDRLTTQQERQDQLEQTRQQYQIALRLPTSVRVATLPAQEVFSQGYNKNRAILSEKIVANQQAFLKNPQLFLRLEDYAGVFPVLPLPDIAKTFRSDAEFTQQRQLSWSRVNAQYPELVAHRTCENIRG